MNTGGALFNWLQISLVAEARPNDHAALETRAFFEQILREDHHMQKFEIESLAEAYLIRYALDDGEERNLQFDKVTAEKLLRDIEAEPRYNQ